MAAFKKQGVYWIDYTLDTIKVYSVPSPQDHLARGRCLCQDMTRSPNVPGAYGR
jgi:hypothetical protein